MDNKIINLLKKAKYFIQDHSNSCCGARKDLILKELEDAIIEALVTIPPDVNHMNDDAPHYMVAAVVRAIG
jgi:hypothetical protein